MNEYKIIMANGREFQVYAKDLGPVLPPSCGMATVKTASGDTVYINITHIVAIVPVLPAVKLSPEFARHFAEYCTRGEPKE